MFPELQELDLISCTSDMYRKSGTWLGQRELRLFKLLLNYISDPSAAENFIDLILPFFSKKDLNNGEPSFSKFYVHISRHIVNDYSFFPFNLPLSSNLDMIYPGSLTLQMNVWKHCVLLGE